MEIKICCLLSYPSHEDKGVKSIIPVTESEGHVRLCVRVCVFCWFCSTRYTLCLVKPLPSPIQLIDYPMPGAAASLNITAPQKQSYSCPDYAHMQLVSEKEATFPGFFFLSMK